MITIDDPMLTTRELAAILNISDRQAETLCSRGAIPAINVGVGTKIKRWRIKTSEALRFRDRPVNMEKVPPVPKRMQLPSHIQRRI